MQKSTASTQVLVLYILWYSIQHSNVLYYIHMLVQLLRVGVDVFRYVTFSAAACWLINIDKNIKGRGHKPFDGQVVDVLSKR